MVIKKINSLFWALSFLLIASVYAEDPVSIKPGKLYEQISLASWQESLRLSSTVGSTFINANPMGFCPGAGYRQQLSSILSWDLNSCFFLGRTIVDSNNDGVIGLNSSLGLLLNAEGGRHQFGIGVPLLIGHSSWTAQTGDTITPNTRVHFGVLLESRFYSNGKFFFDPKLTWLQTDRTFLWSLNFGWDL